TYAPADRYRTDLVATALVPVKNSTAPAMALARGHGECEGPQGAQVGAGAEVERGEDRTHGGSSFFGGLKTKKPALLSAGFVDD
ncbi:hypothetical protein, partial [Lysobacter xanthus]